MSTAAKRTGADERDFFAEKAEIYTLGIDRRTILL